MRTALCVLMLACHHEPTARDEPLPVPAPAIDAGETRDAIAAVVDANVPRPSPYAPVADVITSPDRVEAFALASHDFADVPLNTPKRLDGYPIAKTLARPPDSFVRTFASIVLADDAYRREAVACALSDKHIGLRFARGAEIVEISILAACPSVSGLTSAGRTGGQLEGELADRLAALLRATYPAVFAR